MAESKFQASVKKEIKDRLPGCIVTKLDASSIQGIPDLLILYEDQWATLECKRDRYAPHRPNQDRYVNRMNDMSFSAFVYPENRKEVLDDLERFFKEI